MLSAEHGTILLTLMVDQGDQLGERVHGGGRQARPNAGQTRHSHFVARGCAQTRTVTFRRYSLLQ